MKAPVPPARRRARRRGLIATGAAVAAALLGVGLAVVPASAATTSTLAPAHDTFVNAAAPDDTYATDPTFRVDDGNPKIGLIKFDVPAAPDGQVLDSAVLRVKSLAGEDALEFEVHNAGNAWSDATTWNTRPPVNDLVGTGTAVPGGYAEVDVTAAVTPGSTESFALVRTSTGPDSEFYASENGSGAPELVLTYQDATAPDTRLADALAAVQAAETALQADPADLESARQDLTDALNLVNSLLCDSADTCVTAPTETTPPTTTTAPPPTTTTTAPPPTTDPVPTETSPSTASTTPPPPTTTSPAPDPADSFLPYGADSYFQSRVDGPDVPVDSTRTQQMRDFLAQAQPGTDYPKINLNESWSGHNHISKAGDPLWKLTGSPNNDNSRLDPLRTQGFHVPDSILKQIPTGTQDRLLVIRDPLVGYTAQFADVVPNFSTHTITASSAGIMWHDGNGLDSRAPGGDDRNWVSRGRIPDAMQIPREEVDRAVANGTGFGHLMHVFWVETDGQASPCFFAPMVGCEGKQSGWGEEGLRFRIKPSVDLVARGLTGAMLATARTLQQNGGVIGDNSGSDTQLKFGYPADYAGTNLSTDGFDGKLSWADFEVIQPGWK